ncbi:MAG: hypothetical protein WCA99_11705 [Candidatus Sulfotelmatobacter sp.]
MPDSMTFLACAGNTPRQLCSVNPAALEFDIRSDSGSSQQHGYCRPLCAHNLLEALSQVTFYSRTRRTLRETIAASQG